MGCATVSRTPSIYVHGTAPEEQQRLELLNALLEARSLPLLGLRGDERVLELGAGLGLFARSMRRALPRGRVVAIERSAEQLARARELARAAGEEDAVDWRAGDALHPPLAADEWASFDLAHARFLLEHVNDPPAVVAGMVRAVRPAGRIVLCDDDHSILRLDPPPQGVHELWELYVSQYAKLGNDAYVGRRLAALLVSAGAEVVRTESIHFGGAAGEAHFPALLENLAGVIASSRERVVESGAIEAGDFERTIEGLHAWGRRRDAAIWYSLPWVEGRRPAR